jgi:VWFA-related protein
VLDEQGQPVTDLDSADFQIFDDDKPQPILFFKALPTPGTGKNPPTTLVLFDLLNTFAGQRENSVTLLSHALEPLEQSDSIGLYILTNHADLYPVHALSVPQPAAAQPAGNQKPDDPPWTRQTRALLDQAIQKINALRIKDYQDQGFIAAATFMALGHLGDAFMKIPGPKAIVWISRGAPNWVDYPYGCKDAMFSDGSSTYLGGRCGSDCTRRAAVAKCIDYTPFLQHFSANLTRSDTMVYTVMIDPEAAIFSKDRGRPRDTLEQLADVSGGQFYLHGEIEKAIDQSQKDIRMRYQLAYDAPVPNGKFHKLRVECSRKGVRVVAPEGYYSELR